MSIKRTRNQLSNVFQILNWKMWRAAILCIYIAYIRMYIYRCVPTSHLHDMALQGIGSHGSEMRSLQGRHLQGSTLSAFASSRYFVFENGIIYWLLVMYLDDINVKELEF